MADPLAPPAPRWSRAWARPVWAHLVALAAGLLLLVPVVGTSNSFIADEGAAIIQARSLANGEGWIVEHPLPEVDPEGRWYPVVNAERGTKGFAPLGKHPLYPALAAAAARVGGVAGMVVLSLLGTVAAAGLAAALARRIDKALTRPTLWVVGLASPLLFDGFLVMGHTLGAALATAAVLAAVVAVHDRRPLVALLVAPAVGGAVLLRNEALVFAIALVLVSGFLALRRAYRAPAGLVAAATLAGAVAARLLDRLWVARVTGGAVQATAVGVPAAEDGFIEGRVDGFLTTWLTPSYGDLDLGALALLVMLAAIVWCALRVRSHPEGRAAILGSAGVAAGAAAVALAADPGNVVPGLLLAFPAATAGMLVMRRRLFNDAVAAMVVGATTALFALAVIATQYAVGGSGEWGGRYFALLVPAAVPLLLRALRAQRRSLAADVRRGVAVALVVCSAALSVMAVGALRANHRAGADVVDRVEAAGRLTGDPRPVVVTDWIAGARLAWPTFDAHRWLYVTKGRVAEAVDRLGAAGVDRFVLVSNDVAVLQDRLEGLTVVASDVPPSGRQILVLER
ncbi:MAG TPA: hypothetical protein VHF27_04785 [Acidimicrobiales bacterium]|nr:hypothetical protein [Acidimicrobiales bacterium]